MALKKNIRWFSPRVHSRLKEAASSNTVIITALSGFGKTTAGEYIWGELLPKLAKKVWHTCLDGSPLSEWKRFCAKAGRIDPQAGTALLSLGPPGKTSSGAAASILSDISPDEKTWLFIDVLKNLWHTSFSMNSADSFEAGYGDFAPFGRQHQIVNVNTKFPL